MPRETRSTIGQSWIGFSTHFGRLESSRWWKSVSCRRLYRLILNPIAITFLRRRFSHRLGIPSKELREVVEVVFQLVHHLRERYGDAEVKTWLWEVWNEPDIDYWRGTPEEYFKLYDFSMDAVLRALPQARVGGPDNTGPASPNATEFLRLFLDHCAHQRNYVTGKTGSRLDFVSFHPKGSPKWQGGGC